METTLLLSLAIALVLTFNSDLEKVYNWISKILFDGQSNICRY